MAHLNCRKLSYKIIRIVKYTHQTFMNLIWELTDDLVSLEKD